MRPLLLLLLVVASVNSYKFLVYSAQMGKSHVNFLARISDILVDAGHEVVMVSPIMNTIIGGPGTDKARVIEIPQCPLAAELEDYSNNVMSANVWVQNPFLMFFSQVDMFEAWARTCVSAIEHPGLIEQLKAEKFDVAFGESFDVCGAALFHMLGIEKWAITESIAIRDGGFYVTQTPGHPAYVPSLMQGSSDEMPFLGRLSNVISYAFMDFFMENHYPKMESMLREIDPTLPSIKDMVATNSLVFLNSEPLVDFPKITSARVIDVGGISVSSEHKPLNQTWSDILDLRPKTILLSFGTVARAHGMPEEYKRTIRETFRKFPNVTFIWKYEKPEDNVSAGVPNLIESTWVPQRDMLHDPRLTSFITHCGQGSTTESIDAGIPLIVIPVLADQNRNAHQVERTKIGLRLEKTDLAGGDKLEKAIREIIENDSYRKNAKKLREMIADRPFAMKEIFVKNMEFLAKHGPLRQLDHYGRHLNFFQYYLIDVIAFVALIVISILTLVLVAIRVVLRRIVVTKSKTDSSHDFASAIDLTHAVSAAVPQIAFFSQVYRKSNSHYARVLMSATAIPDVYSTMQLVGFDVVFYAGMLLVTLSFPVYCSVVAVLMCGKKQAGTNNIFFRVFMIGGIIDITAMLNNYLLCGFPQRGWFLTLYTSSIGFGQAYLMISWSIRYAQGITVVVLAFNRLTAVVWPAKYKRMWTSRVGYIINFCQLGIPSCVGVWLSFTTFYYDYNDQGGVYTQFADNDFRAGVFTLSSAVQTLFVAYIIVNYIIVFVYFRKQLRGSVTQNRNDERSKEKQKQENRLLYISVVVCSLEILSWMYSVYAFVINTKMQTRVFYCIFNILQDVYSCTPPYLLILFSTPFQKRIKNFLRISKTVEPTESSSSTVTNRNAPTSSSSSRY